MRVSEIREALRNQPFRPFTVHLADGREFPVAHIDFLLISHTERTIIVAKLNGGYEVVYPVMITSLSFSGEKADAGG
jgi:hypothetical protein